MRISLLLSILMGISVAVPTWTFEQHEDQLPPQEEQSEVTAQEPIAPVTMPEVTQPKPEAVSAQEPETLVAAPEMQLTPEPQPQSVVEQMLQQPQEPIAPVTMPEVTQLETSPVSVPAMQPTPEPQPVVEQMPQQLQEPIPVPVTVPMIQETSQSNEPEEASIKGIDTLNVDEPKGNWLFKRFWWEKAERSYEKIKMLADSIAQTRHDFFKKRTELDRAVLDPLYVNVGIEQGELKALVEFFEDGLQQAHINKEMLPEEEQSILNRLTKEKETIAALQADLDMIRKVDTTIDDALGKLIERISEARNYERQAWEKLKAINRELSDKKAHEHYLAMEAYWKNINNINNYVAHDFTKYFDELLQKINTEIENAKTVALSLKEKGINLKKDAQRLARICQLPHRQETEEQREEPEQQSFFSSIWHSIVKVVTAPFRFVYYGISSVASWIKSIIWGVRPERPEETSGGQEALNNHQEQEIEKFEDNEGMSAEEEPA